MEATEEETDIDKNIIDSDLKKFTQDICHICENILGNCGPFLKETIYQELLIHELNKQNIKATRENVIPYIFKDCDGNDVTIGNNHFMRTDIDLPDIRCILELKQSTSPIKDEHIWQLRNYLEQRPQYYWGIIINFINKFGPSTTPTVQCKLLVKTENYVDLETSNERQIKIKKYKTWSIESKPYVEKNEIFEDFDIV
tara:strand:+ start:88 stop:681 length:594 start_codon:yes stop_codon:yes gene_type:complete